MKLLDVLAGLVMLASVIYCSSDDVWENYKKKHGKDYDIAADGGRRDAVRKEVFLKKLQRIEKHNREKLTSFTKEVNKFSDMLPSELAERLGVQASLGPPRWRMGSISDVLYNRQVPAATLDYRSHNCMPAVKDQGQCGSCWAFAAIAPLEFGKCMKQGDPVILSEQQLVDCNKTNFGCKGGWYTVAWRYLWKASGSAKESFYPYDAQRNTCTFSRIMAGARVSTYHYVKSKSEIAMRQAIQQYGVLATAFSVVPSFYSYKDGVYDDNACDAEIVNHAVVIVGWNELNGVPYWIVRNSWGTNWGQGGYIYVKRGVNKCNIETFAAYVLPRAKKKWNFTAMMVQHVQSYAMKRGHR